MASLKNDGRTVLAMAVASLPIHLAWGSGDPAWDAAPVPSPAGQTALVNEYGRRVATQVQYVVPDDNGEIEVVTGRYKASPVPTRWLHVRFVFDFLDTPVGDIREVALFIGTKVKEDLPPGQRFFTPGQIESPGYIYADERISKFPRSPAIRQTFEYVLPF